MGEAKRRAAAGKAKRMPQTPFQRGLVLRPPFQPTPSGGVQTTGIDPDELRLGLLYWDKIAVPTNNIIGIKNNILDELEREGALIMPQVEMYEPVPAKANVFIQAHITAFDNLERMQPGKWALSQGDRRDLVKGSIVAENTGMLVELVKALPAPMR